MDPLRLHFFLTAACTSCGLPTGVMQHVFAQALRQYHARYPLTGCGITYGGESTHVIATGRN